MHESPLSERSALALAHRHFDALQAAVHAGIDTGALRERQEGEIRDYARELPEAEVPRLLAVYAAEIQRLNSRAQAERSAQASAQVKSRRFYWPFIAAALLIVTVLAAIALPSCNPRN